MTDMTTTRPAGWRLVATITGTIAILAIGLQLGMGGSEGARAAIRFSARTSLVLFLLAFTTAGLHRLMPGPATRWLRLNRRYIGLSFAGSHAVHALAILSYAYHDPDGLLAAVPLIGFVANGIGYAFIIAMAVTSSDRAVAALGFRRWQLLHVTGSYVIWISFLKSYAPRAIADPFYWPFAGILVLALVLRVCAARLPSRSAA